MQDARKGKKGSMQDLFCKPPTDPCLTLHPQHDQPACSPPDIPQLRVALSQLERSPARSDETALCYIYRGSRSMHISLDESVRLALLGQERYLRKKEERKKEDFMHVLLN